MKRLYLFLILVFVVVCISFFFIKVTVPVREDSNVAIEEKQQAADEADPMALTPASPKDNAQIVEAEQLPVKKYVFKKYDHLANARAFVDFLKKKNIGFEIVSEEDGQFGVSVYFEFIGEQDKQEKLLVLKQITGTDYTTGGGVQ